MLYIFSYFGIVASSNHKFHSFFALFELRVFVEQSGKRFQSKVDIFLAFVAIEWEEVASFKFIFYSRCLLIRFELLIEFGQIDRRIENGGLHVEFFQNFEVSIKHFLSIETVHIDFVCAEKREFFKQVDEKSVNLFQETPSSWQQFVRIVAVEDCFYAKESQQRQNYTYLVCNHHLKRPKMMGYQPNYTEYWPNVGEQSFEATFDGIRY